MKNIVWKKPDGSIAVTTMTPTALELVAYAKQNEHRIAELSERDYVDPAVLDEPNDDLNAGRKAAVIKENIGLSSEEHGAILKARAQRHADETGERQDLLDWELVAVDVEIPSDRSRRNDWRIKGGRIVVTEK